MIFLKQISFDLPLHNPVIIFSLVLFIILFAPILFNKIKVPHIIGLILAGVIVGPYGLNLLRRDSSILLFGTVGLLYIIFLAGLEMDLTEFKKNRKKILVFGITTFLLPLIVGSLASYYLLGYSYLSSLLLASMFSTHTLIAYPIASKYGVVKNKAVALAVGGTMITDVLALLILAIVSGMSKEDMASSFWVTLGVSTILFVLTVFLGFPLIIRWFFKRFNDAVSQYIFVLAIVFLAAFLAEAAGLEAIIGAFFSGLVLNQFIPHTSPLMNRIEFVGNALFIPFFLISVGMLVDVTVLVKGWGALKVAGIIIVVAIATKYLAAKITEKAFKLLPVEGDMIFGLSASHAAATLAIILVGYNIITGETAAGEPIRLLNEDVLNGTILLILVSCGISSFVVDRASRGLAQLMTEAETETAPEAKQKILISLARPDSVNELMDIGMMMKEKKSRVPIYVLHVIGDDNHENNIEEIGKKMFDNAFRQAVATENTIQPITRYDTNIANGIIYAFKEHNISDLIIGLHQHAKETDFLGAVTNSIINRIYETIYIYNGVQPLNTLKRIVVAITPNAEKEPGFAHWFDKLVTLAKGASLTMAMYGTEETIAEIKNLQHKSNKIIPVTYTNFSRWDDFLIVRSYLKKNDLLAIITSRSSQPSYQPALEKLAYFLLNYFPASSYLLIYPKQVNPGTLPAKDAFTDTIVKSVNETVLGLKKPVSLLRKLFRSRRK